MGITAEIAARLNGHRAGIYGLALHRGGNALYSGGSDRMVTSWDLQEFTAEKFQANFPQIVYSLLVLPGEKSLVCGTFAGEIHVIDTLEKKEKQRIRAHRGGIFDLAFLEDRNLLVSASGDGSLSFFDPVSFELFRQDHLCAEKVRSLAADPRRGRMAVASGDGMIRIYDTTQVRELHKFSAHALSANAVAWDPSGKWLLSGGRDAHLRIWDTADYKLYKEIPAHNFAIYSIAFHPEGHLLATASRDRSIRIWETAGFRPLITLDKNQAGGHTHSVNRLVWSRYENLLLSCSDDRSIIAWKVRL